MPRGSKVERNSVSEQPHELAYEAKKEGTTKKNVEAAKKQPDRTNAARSRKN
jgi:hypothetical protein